jgi:hypothetical protein
MNAFQNSVANERENLKGNRYFSDQNSGFHGKENELSFSHLSHCAISSVITTFRRNLLPLVHWHPPPAIHTNMFYTKPYITRQLCNTGS